MRDRIINLIAFAALGVLWLGFIAGLAVRPEMLNTTWLSLRGLPLIIQALVWLLALPVVLGLWIWQMSWPSAIRLILVLGLAWATLYAFFPRWLLGRSSALTSKSG